MGESFPEGVGDDHVSLVDDIDVTDVLFPLLVFIDEKLQGDVVFGNDVGDCGFCKMPGDGDPAFVQFLAEIPPEFPPHEEQQGCRHQEYQRSKTGNKLCFQAETFHLACVRCSLIQRLITRMLS